MYIWIIYDISKDKVRAKVAGLCQKSGLRRVQKSVFLGKGSLKTFEKFRKKVYKLINLRTDSLFIVPMTEGGLRNMQLLGKGFGRQHLNNTGATVFF